MKFKLDENFGPRLVSLFLAGNHDIDTVRDEGLGGQSDERVYQACLAAHRALVTLDMDFSNPLRFPPGPTEEIVVVRTPRPLLPLIRTTLESALPQVTAESLAGKLWIVEPGRIRMYDPNWGLQAP